MYRGLRVLVVVPAYNEEQALAHALERIPDWIDEIVVIDDASTDATGRVAESTSRATVLRHDRNRGVGAAIVTGYRYALDRGHDVAAVMAGDGQMNPDDLPGLLDPIADGEADYVKGNRFARAEVWSEMPWTRIAGNVVLSIATRATSGYREVFDSQCGYTAIHRRALGAIDLGRLFPRYGYPNDLLARLRVAEMRVAQVPVHTIYGPNWKSGITLKHALHPIPFVLARSWAWRLGARRGGRSLPRA